MECTYRAATIDGKTIQVPKRFRFLGGYAGVAPTDPYVVLGDPNVHLKVQGGNIIETPIVGLQTESGLDGVFWFWGKLSMLEFQAVPKEEVPERQHLPALIYTRYYGIGIHCFNHIRNNGFDRKDQTVSKLVEQGFLPDSQITLDFSGDWKREGEKISRKD
ncbi:hypothetical protein CL634_05890 [bacterium]|nr:hypothetical protein [bacterium]|tara:strand:+ start:1153 stop:1635 length:483 start_codon:yes stop_codon:yes gene_type:complete